MLTSLIRLKGKDGHPSCFCQRLISQGERRVNIFYTGDGRAHHLLFYHFWKLLWLGEQGLVSPFPDKIRHCSVTVRSNTAVKLVSIPDSLQRLLWSMTGGEVPGWFLVQGFLELMGVAKQGRNLEQDRSSSQTKSKVTSSHAKWSSKWR